MINLETADGLPQGYFHDDEDPTSASFTVCAEGPILRDLVLACLPYIAGRWEMLSVRLVSTHEGHDELDEWVLQHLGIWAQLDDSVDAIESAAACDLRLKLRARTFQRTDIAWEMLADLLRRFEDVLCEDHHTGWMISGLGGSIRLGRDRIVSILGHDRARYDGLLGATGLPLIQSFSVNRWLFRHLFQGSPSLYHRDFTEFIHSLGATDTTGANDSHLFDFETSEVFGPSDQSDINSAGL